MELDDQNCLRFWKQSDLKIKTWFRISSYLDMKISEKLVQIKAGSIRPQTSFEAP